MTTFASFMRRRKRYFRFGTWAQSNSFNPFLLRAPACVCARRRQSFMHIIYTTEAYALLTHMSRWKTHIVCVCALFRKISWKLVHVWVCAERFAMKHRVAQFNSRFLSFAATPTDVSNVWKDAMKMHFLLSSLDMSLVEKRWFPLRVGMIRVNEADEYSMKGFIQCPCPCPCPCTQENQSKIYAQSHEFP